MPWVTIAVMVGLALINAGVSYYKSRKAEKDLESDLPDFEDGNVPRVTESAVVPVVFGTVTLNAPNVVWYIDRGPQNLGFEFDANRVRTHMVLCQGPVELFSMYIDGQIMKDSTGGDEFDLTNGVINLTQGLLAGDPKATGKPWLIGYNAFMPGYPDQVAPSEMVTRMDRGDLPGFRGVFSIFALIGFSESSMEPFEYRVKRVNVRSYGDTQWQPTLAEIAETEMNPAHIIREIYTDTQWGLGNPTSKIDETSFAAAAQTFFDELLGLSFVWGQPDQYVKLIEEVCRHASAACYEEPTTGKLVLKPIRDDYTIGDLITLGPDNVLGSPTLTRPNAFELVTAVEVEYSDRDARRKRTVVARDTAAELLRGTITDRVSYPFIQYPEIANRLATQELLQRSAPLANVRLTVDPTVGKDLRPGDVVIVEYPAKGIERIVLRITDQIEPSIHEPDAGVIIEGVEDVFAFELGQSSVPADISLNAPLLPTTPTVEAFELPLWFAFQEEPAFSTIDPLLDVSTGLVAMSASTADSQNIRWNMVTESDVLPRRTVGTADIGFSPTIQIDLDPLDVDHPDGAINYTDGAVIYKLAGEGIEEPLTGEWLLVYLPDVADDYGAFPQIGAIDVTDWANSTGDLYVGLFDTTTPVVFPTTSYGIVLGYIDWSASPTIRPLYKVDRHAYDVGETIDIEAFTRTLSRILPEDDAPLEQVTMNRRMIRPFTPGNIGITAVNDGSEGGYLDCTYSQRDRGKSQRLQSDSGHEVESGATITVEVYETNAALDTFTYLDDATIEDAQTARWTNADEESARGGGLADVLLFVVYADTGINSLYKNTYVYSRI